MAVEITIISAKHLKNVNWRNGDLVPYAVVSLDDNNNNPSLSTKPDLSGSTRPVWNERFVIPLSNSYPPPPHFLALEVFHSARPDIPVGSVRVSLYGADHPTRIRTLELRRPSGRPHGKIRVKLGLIPTPPPLPETDYRFAPPVSDCYSFTPPADVSRSPPQGFSPLVQDRYYAPGVSCNYDSTPPVSDCYSFAPSDCYNSYPPVSSCYSSTHPTVPASLPPQRFAGQVQGHDFTASVSCNYDSATAPPVPRPSPPPPQRPGSWKPSGQVQVYDFRPPILCNYDSATPPVFPWVVRPPPPQQSASLQVKDYAFSPLFPYNYDSATAPLAPSPLPPRQSSPQAQDHSFSPPVSCNYDSATVTGSLPAQQSSPQVQDYAFSPTVSCNYNSATVTGSLPVQQSSGEVQDYAFRPTVSCNYDSATVTCLLPAQQSSGQAQDYNFSPPASCNYDIATAPLAPSPLPPQQPGSLPAQQSSGQSQDYNFTPLVSYNYNSATATPPRQQTYPPPQPESGMIPPPQQSSSHAQDYNFAPPSLRNYNAAPPPAYPFPIRPRPPQQYDNGYQKPLRPNLRQGSYIGELPSAPVDYNAQYNGDNMNGSGCFGDEVALARAMRGMVLVESDLGSQSGDSEYSRSYSAQPSAPVMRGSGDYGMF